MGTGAGTGELWVAEGQHECRDGECHESIVTTHGRTPTLGAGLATKTAECAQRAAGGAPATRQTSHVDDSVLKSHTSL